MNEPTSERRVRPNTTGKRPRFLTTEQRQATAQNTFAPYWRLGDSLCCRFLTSCASEPSTFEAKKPLFPFFREGTLYGLRRDQAGAPVWMTAAFFAGWCFGRAQPEAALDTVEAADEVAASLRRIQQIQRALARLPPEPPHVLNVMQDLVRRWDRIDGEQLDVLLVDQCVKLLQAGVVAATRAQIDATLSDFAGRIQVDGSHPNEMLHLGAWLRSVADACGRPVICQLRHPLFRVGAEYYVDRPLQWSVMSNALERVLSDLNLASEQHCPWRPAEMIALVGAAFRLGRRMRHRTAARLAAIREEAGPDEWDYACRVVSEVARNADSIKPAALSGAIHLWHEETYGPGDGSYGHRLSRAVRWFDLAVWLGWLTPTGETPDVLDHH